MSVELTHRHKRLLVRSRARPEQKKAESEAGEACQCVLTSGARRAQRADKLPQAACRHLKGYTIAFQMS
jgi:hypothetical protein